MPVLYFTRCILGKSAFLSISTFSDGGVSSRDLSKNGAYAVYLQQDGLKLAAANDLRGTRPLSTRPEPSH